MIDTTLEQIVAATGGRRVLGSDRGRRVGGVSTDTRSLAPGDLYVPLVGEHFDGHAFVADAVRRGAAGFLFAESSAFDAAAVAGDGAVFAVAVADTLRALGDLAHDVVRRSGARVVAVTGSMGKTTVKEMTARLLRLAGPTCATHGNFNNLVGLPLSVFRAGPEDRFLALEMGMSEPGEIARLAEIAPPDVGVVTNVAEVHLEQLRTLEAVAAAKGELYRALRPGAVAVVNSADDNVVAQAGHTTARRVTFGDREGDDVRIRSIQVRADGTPSADLVVRGEPLTLRLRVLGGHNVWNAAAAIAATHAALGDGAPPVRDLAEALDGYTAPPNRGERFVHDGVTWLSDCYNANPRATGAALRTLAAAPVGGRRVAVLGDMRELGDYAERAHRDTGANAARAGVDRLYAVGEWARAMAEEAHRAGLPRDRVATAADVLEVADDLRTWLREGDWVLLKGSRGLKMERLLDALGVR